MEIRGTLLSAISFENYSRIGLNPGESITIWAFVTDRSLHKTQIDA